MNKWARICIYLLTVILIICGTFMIYMRGVMPDTNGWSIVHETQGDEFIRTEKGIITAKYHEQYIVIVTARQKLDIYIDDVLILSSQDFNKTEPVATKFAVRITDEFIGKEMRIVFTTPFHGDSHLMREALSFQRINPGIPEIDYSITAISVMCGLAALILAFAFGIQRPGSGSICLFALMNFMLAFNTVRGDSIIGYETLNPRLLLIVSQATFYIYMWPLLLFFYITLTGMWKKCAFVLILSTVIYAAAAVILNAARIIPFGLTDDAYNYVLSLAITLLILMMALQPKEKNQFSLIARLHLVLWTAWGISAAIRLLVFDMTLQVNVEYRIMYSFTLISLTFFGIYTYGERITKFQEREHIMSIKTESLMHSYEQVNTHLHEVNSLKHDIRNHLTALHLLLKDDRFTEAKNYLEKYAEEVGDVSGSTFHSNYLINAIVHDMMQRAKDLDIKTVLNLKASPNAVSEHDIVSLLTNIINNALEACEKMPKGHSRFISLSITRRDPYLAIVCENSNPGEISTDLDGDAGTRINTSKHEKGHGYGLQTIQRIAAAYGGMMEVTYDDELFSITVALKDE